MTATVEQDHVDRFLESISPVLPDLDLEVEGIVDRITGLSRRLYRMLDETLESQGLSTGEWKVLAHLSQAGPPFRRSPGQLAKRAELSSGAMTNRLDRLERAGLIRRLPDTSDRRGTHVELTAAGKKAYEKSVATQAAKEALIAGALNDREKEHLNALLRRLMLAAEQLEKPR
jgi:DNA-binding MarR family transcriptional regulator